MKYANVIVDISHEKVDKSFQYRIPENLQNQVQVGMEVAIPFGRGNTKRSGYVIELTNHAECGAFQLKEILEVNKDKVSAESDLIRLAFWLKSQYGGTMIAALRTVLPVKEKMKPLEKKQAVLLLSEEEAQEKLAFFKEKHQKARERLLTALLMQSPVPQEYLTGKLNISLQTIRALSEMGIVEILTKEVSRNPVKKQEGREQRPTLNLEQRNIIEEFAMDRKKNITGTYLIHGVTGSGKTEVYMALIEQVIQEGKQAIVLIPEIALTYQTLLRFYKRFGNRVSVMNSRLSKGERYDQFKRAEKGEIDIVIGPRSALFIPFLKLGLIVIDEEQETSYKSENVPRYHAREVALELGKMKHASVVLGSATPSVEAYYQVSLGKTKLFSLTKRVTGGMLPKIYTVDLREELKQGNRSIFSRKLQELIADRLEKKQQIMLFLNRRGYAGFVSCRSCGHVMKCPHCEVSLAEHKNGKLICHYCGYQEPMVHKCPSCGSPFIAGFKAGTQQIAEHIHTLYPKARVLRMDADTTKTKESYEQILSAFSREEADILIGTQMIVKGHDFKKVTLVGILAADLSLHANDYRGGERTFQLLTQAAGRAGRGELPGEAVIQTYQPEHYSIRYAEKQDYEGFYQEEICYRELLKYPPIWQLMAVLISSKEEESGKRLAEKIADFVKRENSMEKGNTVVVGPAPGVLKKKKDVYRTVLFVKQKEYEVLVKIKDDIQQLIERVELKEENVQFDFNPVNVY